MNLYILFDSYSKTLTPFEYPMTEKALQEQQLNNVKYEYWATILNIVIPNKANLYCSLAFIH